MRHICMPETLPRLISLAITEHNHRRAPSQLENNPQLYNGAMGTSLISAARHFTVDNEFVAIYVTT